MRQPGKIVKRFSNARYHVLKAHYDYAIKPILQNPTSFLLDSSNTLIRFTG